MPVTLHVPAVLRPYCDGAAQLSLHSATVRDALAELQSQYPALYRSIFDETDAVRRHVNLFVNQDHIRDRDGLDTALSSGDAILVLPAVSGG